MTGNGRLKGTAVLECGDDGGTFGGKNASLIGNPASGITKSLLIGLNEAGKRDPTSLIYHVRCALRCRSRAAR